MDKDFLIQLAASAAAVGALIALAAWAKIARPAGPLDERKARTILTEEFPGRAVQNLWIASDGAGALARSGGLALVICQVGDGFVARQAPWAQVVCASFKDGKLRINLDDISAPTAVIALPAWPPKDLAA